MVSCADEAVVYKSGLLFEPAVYESGLLLEPDRGLVKSTTTGVRRSLMTTKTMSAMAMNPQPTPMAAAVRVEEDEEDEPEDERTTGFTSDTRVIEKSVHVLWAQGCTTTTRSKTVAGPVAGHSARVFCAPLLTQEEGVIDTRR